MKDQKKIALICYDKVIKNAFTNQLNDIFGDEVLIKSYMLKDKNIDISDCDLAICSSKAIYENVQTVVPANIKLITARRAINLANLSEVINLKAGQKVLVVSNYMYTAMETIMLLKELGIDYIDYIPYYSGAKLYDADVAITPGGSHLVPHNIKRIIDLGVKLLDVSTIIEILINLDLPLENANVLPARYTKEMIQLNKYNNELNSMLKGILNTSHDGILAINNKGKISFYNQRICDLVGLDSHEIMDKYIADIANEQTLYDLILDPYDRINEIIYCNQRQVMVNKIVLRQGNSIAQKVLSVKDITQIQKLEYEVRKKLRNRGFIARYTFKDIVGSSVALNKTVKIAKKIARTDLTVLIQGEDGTGKELFAHAIHNESTRKNDPFIAANFGALSESLMESELFGYEEGAFTGAKRGGRPGLFEQAHTGTIFLDEIGDASPGIQARLLRVLQEKQVMRVGGTSIIPIDVRVIAATNKSLEKLVEEGRFRKDLYYRLKVLHIRLPNLKERRDDIPYLIKYFLEKHESKKIFSKDVLDVLYEYHWPGNIRELENIISYIITIAESLRVTKKDLPEEFVKDVKDMEGFEVSSKNLEEELKIKGNIKEFIWILEELRKGKNSCYRLGRNKIIKALNERNITISPDKIRNRLKTLEDLDLVLIGKTRQGTIITDLGEEFLMNYERKQNNL